VLSEPSFTDAFFEPLYVGVPIFTFHTLSGKGTPPFMGGEELPHPPILNSKIISHFFQIQQGFSSKTL
jgi:hypothetical protein